MQEHLKVPKDVFTSRCIVCGFALYQHEIGGEVINGIYVDYGVSKGTGTFSGCFCVDCWSKMMEISAEDPYVSVRRRINLQEMDSIDIVSRGDCNSKSQNPASENMEFKGVEGEEV